MSPLTMSPALLKAHQKLDTAVDAAYQPSSSKKSYAADAERLGFLFAFYLQATNLLSTVKVSESTSARARSAVA